MKKMFSVFLAVSVAGFMTSTAASGSVSAPVYTANEAVELYDAAMNSSQWKNSISRAERGEMVQLPEDALENMSTAELTEAVLEYPFFIDVYAFDNIEIGIEALFDTFNGAEELSKRPDAAKVLIEKYEAEPVAMTADEADDMFRIMNLEILLAQDFAVQQLTEEEVSKLSKLSFEKYNDKKESVIYSDSTAGVFYDLIGVQTESADLMTDTRAALL